MRRGRDQFGSGGEGGFRKGRRRLFDSGELRLVLLWLLEKQARHGYDLIRDLEDRTSGAYTPSPGVIYPTLSVLEDLGHIEEVRSDGAKRLFSITASGRVHIQERRTEVDIALARLDALAVEHNRTDAGPVWRAMQNLKAVLRQRLAGTKDKKTPLDVAELIDEAARKIERL
jgi:DNA-binding PadR family transcriptional regulator